MRRKWTDETELEFYVFYRQDLNWERRQEPERKSKKKKKTLTLYSTSPFTAIFRLNRQRGAAIYKDKTIWNLHHRLACYVLFLPGRLMSLLFLLQDILSVINKMLRSYGDPCLANPALPSHCKCQKWKQQWKISFSASVFIIRTLF